MTVQVLICSAVVGFFFGMLFGIATCSKLRMGVISSFIEVFTFILRAIPFYVLLLIVYFVLPDLFRINIDPFPASILALGMSSSGYVAQIIRAGINTIPMAQWEAASSLGYSTRQTLFYIILPQMFRNVLPNFNNELDQLLKSTAIVSSIGLLELTRMGMNIVSRDMRPVPIYLTIAGFYICMSLLLNLLARTLETRLAYVKH